MAQPALIYPRYANLTNILYALFLLILLTRSSLDTVLETVQIDIGTNNSLTFGAAINALLIGITALLALIHPYRIPWRAQFAWISFIIFCTIMSLGTPDPIGVARFLLVLTSYQCAFMLPFFFARTAQEATPIINTIIYSSILPTLVAIGQISGSIPPPADGRIASTFTHPNIFAFYLLAVSATIAYRFASPTFRDTTLKRIVLIAYSGLLGIFLLATQTRSAWLGATIILLGYAVFVRREALLAFVALPLVILFSSSIQERLLNILEPAEYIGNGVILNSYDWRRQLWHDAGMRIEQSSLQGHGGLGSFFAQSQSFFSLGNISFYAHNVFIQLSFEVGIIGAALFFVIFSQKAWIFISAFKIDRAASVIGTAFCFAYLAVSNSNNMLYYLASNWYTFALLGTLMAFSRSSGVSDGLASRHCGSRSIKYPLPIQRTSDALPSVRRQRIQISQLDHR